MNERAVVMEGSLDEFDLVSVVQTVSIGRQSTGIELRDDRGAVVGTLLLKAGQLVTAQAEGASGVEALRRLLRTSRLRRFYVYRANTVELRERIGPVTQILASILTQQSQQPEAPPMLMQGSLAQYDLRMVAEAVSLGRQSVGIEVFAPDGRRVGALYLKGGQILFAAWGRSAGEAALGELFKPRKSGRFVVFRSPHTRVGEPIARLADILYPRPKTDSVVIDLDAPASGEVDTDDTQITRVSLPPSELEPVAKKPSTTSAAPPQAAAQSARPARPSVPPPAARTSVPPPVPGKSAPPPVAKAAAASPPAREVATVIPSTYPAVEASRPASANPPAARPASAPNIPAVPAAKSQPAVAATPPSGSTRTAPASSELPLKAPAPTSSAPVEARAPVSQPPAQPISEAPAAPKFRRSEAPSSAPLSLLDEPRVTTPAPTPRTPVLCITSPKGGTGRTTITLNLAVTLARRGKRVVVVDADQSGLLTALHAQTERPGAADVLAGRATLEAALITTRMAGLRLLPSGELDAQTHAHSGWQPLLNSLSAQADVVLVDCAASLYGATPTLLTYATHQLLVVAAEPSAQRVYSAYRSRLRKLATTPPSLGVVLNMLDYQVPASVRALEELCAGEHAREVLDVTIPRSPAFMEASARGLPIVHAEQGSSSAIGWLFETLASALLERLKLETPVFAAPLLA